jgi:ABC-2 type transport system ATP-binding protein
LVEICLELAGVECFEDLVTRHEENEGTMTKASIIVKNLNHRYGEHHAVKDVSFEVAPGEVLGFLGPNGAGKSTTIKVLSGQVPVQSGDVEILGMNRRGDRAAIQAKINVSFEEKNLYEDMTAKENVEFFAELYGIKNIDAKGILERVGLADRMNDRVSNYSKGMRQRLMIARCLANSPMVLFLDEPTDGLDPVSAKAIRALIMAEAARGCAIMLTTHDMNEADQLSDRVAFIAKGGLVALDTPERLKLQHGKRSVRIRYEGGREVHIALDGEGAEAVASAMKEPGVLSVHTEEATLEDIFVQLAKQELN